MPSDLVSGRYPLTHAYQSMFGLTAAVAQGNLPIRSNLEWGVYSGPAVDTASLGGPTTAVMGAVPVPVDQGTVVSNVSILIGATPAGTPLNGWAALYSGTAVSSPPLIGQSTDQTTAAMIASTRFDYTLTTPQLITATNAPYGYVWVAIMSKASTVPSAVTLPCGAAACQYRWFAGTPLYFSITAGSGLTATAPATLIKASILTVAPIVFCW